MKRHNFVSYFNDFLKSKSTFYDSKNFKYVFLKNYFFIFRIIWL